MTLLEKIDYLMYKSQLNKHTLSDDAGIPYTTIIGWYKRGFDSMSLSTFRKLCRFFGVTMDSMAFDDREIEYYDPEAKSFYTSEEERRIIQAFRSADDLGQKLTLRTLKLDEIPQAAESSRPLTAAETAESKRASVS